MMAQSDANPANIAEATLTTAACAVLQTSEPARKTALTAITAEAWRSGRIAEIGSTLPPGRPARPSRPALRPPREVPRRRITAKRAGRVALLHALAHIELNAIDLAWDIIARFAAAERLPKAYFDDWVGVAADEAKHFTLLTRRLSVLGSTYGAFPAHDGLWEAATATASDLTARLAVVPLVLEARGLDVTPAMMARLRAVGDGDSADVLEVIHDDEIVHVAVGKRWFDYCCERAGLDPVETFQSKVRQYFKGVLKPPFNADSRARAGLTPDYYHPLAHA